MAFAITLEQILMCTSGLYLEPSSLQQFADETGASSIQNVPTVLPFKYIHAVVLVKQLTPVSSYLAPRFCLYDQQGNICGAMADVWCEGSITLGTITQLISWGGFTPMLQSNQFGFTCSGHGGSNLTYDVAILTK